MAPLKSLRQETFCHKVIEAAKLGLSHAVAYERSGYRTTGHASEVNASKLLSKTEIQERIAELMAPAARKIGVTVETLLHELEESRSGAVAAEQYGAANGAIGLKGKLTGLLRDKVEIGGPGDFDGLETLEGVAEKMLEDTEPADLLRRLDALRDAVEALAGRRAILVKPAYVALGPPVPFNIKWRRR
jgi:hypothetical protein